jgi:cyclopropane-fatty-acyl-phospholipid synthase
VESFNGERSREKEHAGAGEHSARQMFADGAPHRHWLLVARLAGWRWRLLASIALLHSVHGVVSALFMRFSDYFTVTAQALSPIGVAAAFDVGLIAVGKGGPLAAGNEQPHGLDRKSLGEVEALEAIEPDMADVAIATAARRPGLPAAGRFLVELFDRFLVTGRVRFRLGAAEICAGTAGDGAETVLRIHHPRFFARVLRYGNLGLGEAFMDGDVTVEAGELHEFLTACLRSRIDERLPRDPRLAARALYHRTRAFLDGSTRSVRRHYDIGDDLFESFLDSSMTYSCGYARSPGDDLETLQRAKLDRICRKLRLGPDQRLLDIGCGFGGLLIFAARHYGVRGTGVTLSLAHAERARSRVAEAGLADRLRIELGDFRAIDGEYDRIVSVGMLEHVPRRLYGAFFRTVARNLAPLGYGLVHAIGCNAARNRHDPFIQKYVFPDSNQPRLSEIASGLERNGLAILDVENNAEHYAYTVLGWLTRFRANRAGLAARYDETFLRLWEYYFHCGIAAAFASDSAVYQTLFAADRSARPPLARV